MPFTASIGANQSNCPREKKNQSEGEAGEEQSGLAGEDEVEYQVRGEKISELLVSLIIDLREAVNLTSEILGTTPVVAISSNLNGDHAEVAQALWR